MKENSFTHNISSRSYSYINFSLKQFHQKTEHNNLHEYRICCRTVVLDCVRFSSLYPINWLLSIFSSDDILFNTLLMKHVSYIMSAGGVDEHAGKDEAGAGFHQAASLLHTAVTTGEGQPPHQHEARAQETAGGDPGDEVSTITM